MNPEDNKIYSIDQIKSVCTKLNLPYQLDLVGNVEKGCNTEKLSISIIGKYKLLTKLVSSLFQTGDLIPKKIKTNNKYAGNSFKFSYADSLSYKIKKKNSNSFFVEKEQFFQVMLSNEDALDSIDGEIGLNSDILKTLTVSLYFADNDFDSYNWSNILVQSDYTFVTLDATQLLSLKEQHFITTVINHICNPERYSLIVASMENIDELERDDVTSYIDTFTMCLNTVIPRVITYGKEEETPFNDFVKRHIITNAIKIRESSNMQNLHFLNSELYRCCQEIKKTLMSDSSKILDSLAQFGINCEEVQKSIRLMERSVDIFISGRIKNQFINKIDSFSESLNKDLKQEITVCQNIDDTTRQLPIYLKTTWERFIERQNLWLKDEVFKETVEISKNIEFDVKKIITAMDIDTIESIKEYLPAKFRYNAFLHPKREHGDSLKYVDLGAIGMLLISIPWSIVIFTTSQLIRYFFKDVRMLAKKESLSESAIECSNKMKNQIINQADVEVENISNAMKNQAKEVYETILLDFTNAIETYQDNLDNSEETINYIDTLYPVKAL